jgi:hypothetical protein
VTDLAPRDATLHDTAARAAHVARLRRLGEWLDNAVRIPGTRFGIGLDGLIGLIPGIGDAVGAALAGYIVIQAARLGASRATLVRMLLNVGVDTVIGAIPAVGDLFDFGWKANARNLALLHAHLERPAAVRASSRRVIVAVGAGVILFLVAVVALAAMTLNAVVERLWHHL